MNHKKIFSIQGITCLLILSIGLLSQSCSNQEKRVENNSDTVTTPTKPNIVFILIDDLGMISTPLYSKNKDSKVGYVFSNPKDPKPGSYTTPNMDLVASQGVRFNNMYATPLCATSRAELMTGRYTFRNNMIYPAYPYPTKFPATDTSVGFLDTNANLCYPKVLKQQGYKTAFGGKWNMRYGRPNTVLDTMISRVDHNVKQQREHLQHCGFDLTFGPDSTALLGAMVDYYPPQMNGKYFPYQLNEWMVNYIKNAKSNEPFYLHYCLGLIHDSYSPNYGNGKIVPLPPGQDTNMSKAENWATRMNIVDTLIGNVLQALSDSGLDTNTIVIIAGDNGTENNYYTLYEDRILQGGKGTLDYYGSRVPFIVKWPNHIDSNIEYNELADFSDVFTTMVELSDGQKMVDKWINAHDSNYVLDGFSFLQNITNGTDSLNNPIRDYVYSQFCNSAFVANKSFQVTYQKGDTPWLTSIVNGPGNGIVIPKVPEGPSGKYPSPIDSAAFSNLNGIYNQLGANLKNRNWGNTYCPAKY
ncbi:MAG: hypothetical protein CL840_14570 [Crocinitomicaceae bacterium]|nr:hypothetical protein [Crocinitomicaceae bacterium]|tara:strand:+ start:5863 stop:7443 length:1581 start_codon:yes stop_codon:yes gene_type:complete